MSTDYNAAKWTAEDLLTDVYRACRMPDTGTVDYTPTVVLRIASDAIWDWATHKLSGARDGRSLSELNRTVTSGAITLAGDEYELPPMAVADAIEKVEWVLGSNARTLQLIPRGVETVAFAPSNSGDPEAYSLRDGCIRVYPRIVNNSGGYLRIVYQRRHGDLVNSALDVNYVQSDVVNKEGLAQINLTPPAQQFAPGAWIDIIGRYYPYRHKLTGAKIVSFDGTDGESYYRVTLSTPYEEFMAMSAAGDIATLHGKTPFVHLPLEFRGPLTKAIAKTILDEIGDVQLGAVQGAAADAGGARVMDMMAPRTKAQRAKLFNPFSLARMGVRRSPRGVDTR